MKIIDITGPLANGMWSYGEHFPKLNIKVITGTQEGFGEYSFTSFEGVHALSGTFLETPAHFLGYKNSYLINEVPLKKLFNIDCVVLNVEMNKVDNNGISYVTQGDLQACFNSSVIEKGDAIIVGKGWGDKMWFSKEHFPKSPYFTYEAFMWLLDKQPSIIGSDTSAWDNFSNPSGFFEKFYRQNVLMLAGCMNLKKVTEPRVKLTVLPLNVENSCASPCRAIIVQD